MCDPAAVRHGARRGAGAGGQDGGRGARAGQDGGRGAA